ncbi:MAG: radical SAM protein [Dehalococcoides mccartyi]|uniref:Radical SAM protein n=1 Tax=Dehalococcoides mccartyi TaxID=61435 RepID=A0AB38Z7X7_9CHLR|nr:radical SAM protein [Dehalococcoides mccartyi]WRO06683.1 radical SAM protein [Dehalococcoides mccartyi]
MSANNNKLMLNLAKEVLINSKTARNIIVKQYEKKYYKQILRNEDPLCSKNANLVKYYGVRAMAKSVIRNYDEKYISRESATRIINTLLESAVLQGNGKKKTMAAYRGNHGIDPPFFMAIAPTKKCNLCCTGCYASSRATTVETLDWPILDKIMHEAHDEMGIRFFVITGGEPLTYQNEGKTILDLPRQWHDSFFLMYTNGTLIDKKMAEEISKLGNLTPAISVEGFEEQTDARRGSGVYQQILKAMSNLRNEGVLFGTSVTATKNNIDVLLNDKLYSYYFENMRSSYMWLFQYMPIGRKFTTDLMLTPEQRFELFRKWQQLLKEKEWFVADFWNSAILSDGCISCARSGGYFYIDWNGNIMPCVFIPYYKDNVKDLFQKGKKIQDALFSDFFAKGRDWQNGYRNSNGNQGNMLMPCFIRDHHQEFLRIARDECHVLPEDAAAEEAMEDADYHAALMEFDEKLKAIEEPCWNSEFKMNPKNI